MTVDYAKRMSEPPRKRGLWVVALIAIAAAILLPAAMFFMHHHTTTKLQPQTLPLSSTKATAQIKPAAQQTIKKIQQQKSQFDFYAMLPKQQVAIKHPQNGRLVQIPANTPYFLLQIATTNDQKAAKALSEKLGLMGLNAYIKPYQKSNLTTGYRVLSGPYIQHNTAVTDQDYLNTNHISSLLLSIKPKPNA